MNTNNPDEVDLKRRFAALKGAVEVRTPAWGQCWQMKPERISRLSPVMRKAAVAAAAAAVALLVVSYWQDKAAAELAEALPPLFEERVVASGSDFLGLVGAGSPARWPSDFLAPTHLNLIIP